ncbi:lazarillo protein-like [Macrosteles quadrilineatus]|uniref:lazarillo protein-like n=1 Tax=Macrosteles quadrilineatus TaxID=74068 RepID=UPI0023E28846|nr:lazarillo protein-like [Macrosteles quadrilineatus]XP_054285224.1 lazarillo protein-like [Macrosteles quadrilineatus]XP_054285225.1 lazarillo protein-like [Macrosteles quadrilineatus]
MLSRCDPLRFLTFLIISSATQMLTFAFQLPKLGGCPDLAAQQNFLSDIDSFLGKWYVQSSYDTEILQGKGRCMAANYKYIPLNNNILVQTGQFNEDNNKWERLDANAAPANVTKNEGKFKVKFTIPIWGEVEGAYTVLDTDRINYSVVHGCGSIFGILHYDCSWLMSRKKNLTPEEEEEYYQNTSRVLGNYKSLDPKEFKKVDQVNCEKEAI